MTGVAEAPVKKSIAVNASVDTAFKVFTEGFDTWWPRTHHIGPVDMVEAVLEQGPNGRWFERGIDGSECEWGRVLAWEPPGHLAVSWHLNGEFKYDPDPNKASVVDVRFTAVDDNTTRVDLEHKHLDRHGEGWEQAREGVSREGGWPGLLQMFAEAVTQARTSSGS